MNIYLESRSRKLFDACMEECQASSPRNGWEEVSSFRSKGNYARDKSPFSSSLPRRRALINLREEIGSCEPRPRASRRPLLSPMGGFKIITPCSWVSGGLREPGEPAQARVQTETASSDRCIGGWVPFEGICVNICRGSLAKNAAADRNC